MINDFGNPDALSKAIELIRSKLGASPNVRTQAETEAGFHPNLLTRGGRLRNGQSIPVIQKYLIGATAYLRQPVNYYDIFGAARCVLMTQLLGEVLQIGNVKTRGADDRLNRLVPITDSDSYESTLLELVAGSRYAIEPTVDQVEFIPERKDKKTADFVVKRGIIESFVECKKVARVKQISATTRAIVRERLNPVLSHYRKSGVSAMFEIDFTSDPAGISESELLSGCRAAFEEKTGIVTPGFTVTAKPLHRFEHDGPILYPSPKFWSERYGFRVRSEWFGVVQAIEAQPVHLRNVPMYLKGGVSTWILAVAWDTAIKWKITAPQVVAKYRRFAFDNVFGAVKQINNAGKDSTAHIWLETDYSIGRRKDVMLDLFARLNQKKDHFIGWIVLNETLLDVSPLGRFDLIEHAHLIKGPTAVGDEPIVSGLFGTVDKSAPKAEFGIGADLPDVDEE
jgi:hypothetical protein